MFRLSTWKVFSWRDDSRHGLLQQLFWIRESIGLCTPPKSITSWSFLASFHGSLRSASLQRTVCSTHIYLTNIIIYTVDTFTSLPWYSMSLHHVLYDNVNEPFRLPGWNANQTHNAECHEDPNIVIAPKGELITTWMDHVPRNQKFGLGTRILTVILTLLAITACVLKVSFTLL